MFPKSYQDDTCPTEVIGSALLLAAVSLAAILLFFAVQQGLVHRGVLVVVVGLRVGRLVGPGLLVVGSRLVWHGCLANVSAEREREGESEIV
jgi:hypothetical protein